MLLAGDDVELLPFEAVAHNLAPGGLERFRKRRARVADDLAGRDLAVGIAVLAAVDGEGHPVDGGPAAAETNEPVGFGDLVFLQYAAKVADPGPAPKVEVPPLKAAAPDLRPVGSVRPIGSPTV